MIGSELFTWTFYILFKSQKFFRLYFLTFSSTFTSWLGQRACSPIFSKTSLMPWLGLLTPFLMFIRITSEVNTLNKIGKRLVNLNWDQRAATMSLFITLSYHRVIWFGLQPCTPPPINSVTHLNKNWHHDLGVCRVVLLYMSWLIMGAGVSPSKLD